MYTATANVVLPTTIIGSLPRPGWYTQNLGGRDFREAMVDRTYREQYLDAVSSYVRDQEVAGLDIVTDGDCRFDADVAGHNWFSYAPLHMEGFSGMRPLFGDTRIELRGSPAMRSTLVPGSTQKLL